MTANGRSGRGAVIAGCYLQRPELAQKRNVLSEGLSKLDLVEQLAKLQCRASAVRHINEEVENTQQLLPKGERHRRVTVGEMLNEAGEHRF